MKKRIISLLLCLALCIGMVFALVGCGGGGPLSASKDALVIMSEALDGLFNPFYSTSGADMTIVSMTQIGMLSSKVNETTGDVEVAFGENEAVVTKDYEQVYDSALDETTYTFVIKNGIKFSDGHPLTIEDVLFNLYVYLDPVYTGSSTIYSTAIKGLTEYRTQIIGAGDDDEADNQRNELAASRASERIQTLVTLFETFEITDSSYRATEQEMRDAIAALNFSNSYSGYKQAIALESEWASIDFNEQLLEDYNTALEKFREELNKDYETAKTAYTEEPYSNFSEFENEMFCYMFYNGYIDVEYKNHGKANEDKSVIERLIYDDSTIPATKEAAIDRVYNDNVIYKFNEVIQYWATASEMKTEFTAQAKEVILQEAVEDGFAVENIEGIVSLAHTSMAGSTINVNGTDYTIADSHGENGVPQNGYDVLQITIEGKDPKAQWNFAFTVAPQHYYGNSEKFPVDIENNQFGVKWGSATEFMKQTVQSSRNLNLPMGAGPYKVTNSNNSDTPAENEFSINKVVYFKANNYFETVGEGINNPKIEKLRYQEISANNAISALETGSVHFITPQFTDDNYSKIEGLMSRGAGMLESWQLGYGYIGINAEKVPDINIRRAIMCAMDTAQALTYYRSGTAEQIYWPMSTQSWAYPKDENGNPDKRNGHSYPARGAFNEQTAIDNIEYYMEQAGVAAGDKSLELDFTIAGANLTDHPTYSVFRDAADLLNSLGWNVTVKADIQALTKLSTGSLAVWAAAWGSTIDPDMYQVYHKNSTATSTNAWGYSAIKNRGDVEEMGYLNDLSDIIDEARETLDQEERKELYKEAMGYVLDLAIELPVYQRKVLYAYNANVIDADTLPDEVNPYTSPLDRIWEIEFTD